METHTLIIQYEEQVELSGKLEHKESKIEKSPYYLGQVQSYFPQPLAEPPIEAASFTCETTTKSKRRQSKDP